MAATAQQTADWNPGRMVGNRCFTLAGGIVAVFGLCVGAAAQGLPRPPGSIPEARPSICFRLESQLAAIDRGPADPTRAAQINRYEEALRQHQAELDRTIVRSRRLGCGNTGFFSLFSNPPAECGPLTRQIQQLHSRIDRLMVDLQQVRGGTASREGQRQSVLAALSENNCGPQYRSASVDRSRGLFESLFGPGSIVSPGPSPFFDSQSSTYRTLCVRTCDGYYWPISFSTMPERFTEDSRTCQRMCPAAQVVLYTHRNPGEDVSQAVSLGGQVYADLPTAFAYRKQFNPACSCKRANETWAHALQNLDDNVERGDILVTEEQAKRLSTPREQRSSRGGRKATTQPSENTPPATPALRGNISGTAKDDKTVRSVGPTFLPRQ